MQEALAQALRGWGGHQIGTAGSYNDSAISTSGSVDLVAIIRYFCQDDRCEMYDDIVDYFANLEDEAFKAVDWHVDEAADPPYASMLMANGIRFRLYVAVCKEGVHPSDVEITEANMYETISLDDGKYMNPGAFIQHAQRLDNKIWAQRLITIFPRCRIVFSTYLKALGMGDQDLGGFGPPLVQALVWIGLQAAEDAGQLINQRWLPTFLTMLRTAHTQLSRRTGGRYSQAVPIITLGSRRAIDPSPPPRPPRRPIPLYVLDLSGIYNVGRRVTFGQLYYALEHMSLHLGQMNSAYPSTPDVFRLDRSLVFLPNFINYNAAINSCIAFSISTAEPLSTADEAAYAAEGKVATRSALRKLDHPSHRETFPMFNAYPYIKYLEPRGNNDYHIANQYEAGRVQTHFIGKSPHCLRGMSQCHAWAYQGGSASHLVCVLLYRPADDGEGASASGACPCASAGAVCQCGGGSRW